MEKSTTLELTDYCCGNCHGNTWELSIAHSDDGKTYLVVVCANQACVNQRKKELGVDPEDEDAWVLWDQLEITGQGYDKDQQIVRGISNTNN